MRIHCGVVALLFFRVDIPPSSQSIGFGSEVSGVEADDEVELRQELRPASLAAGQEFQGREVFKVLVVCENLDFMLCAFKVVTPFFQGANDGKEFSVIDVIILFSFSESFGIVGTGVPLVVRFFKDRKNGTSADSGGISFNMHRAGVVRVGEDGFGDEGGLEGVESGLAGR